MHAPSEARVREALHHIPPDLARDEWVRVAMALKSALGEDGFDLFDTWSQRGQNYRAADAKATWRSVTGHGGIGLGSLVRLAKEHGFKGSLRNVQAAVPAKAAEHARDEAHARAAKQAADLWAEAKEDAPCAYLDRKRVKAYGVRVARDGWLTVPLRDAEGVLWNVQRIAPTKPQAGPDKLLLPGSRKTGLHHWCGDAAGAEVLLLAEGYATAATLHEATGWPCAMAIDAGNLVTVAKSLHQAHPTALIVVCADDDRETALRTGTNTGQASATAAATEVGGLVVLPLGLPDDGTDFNDLALHAGLEAVRRCVTEAVHGHHVTQRATAVATPRNVTDSASRLSPGDDHVTGDDPYTLNEQGVWFHERDREGQLRRPVWVCSPLHVTAQTRDLETGGWGLLLQFCNPSGTKVQLVMPNRTLAGDGTEFRATLMDRGLRIATGARERGLLARYVQTRPPAEHVNCTPRLGWHGPNYVFPDRTLGPTDEPVVYQGEGASVPTIGQRGSLADWQRDIAALCAGNSRLAFALCCAFAGPVLRLVNLESGGFHYLGESSSGKTTALRVAGSVYGGPSFLQRWRATDNALEAIAAQHSDLLLILDELAQVDPRTAGEVAYMLANEMSKARSTRSGHARPRLQWRMLFLSAGEIGLAAHMAEGGKRSRAGQEARLADIPADAGAGLGIFEQLHGYASGADLARHLGKACDRVHGAVGQQWIAWLVDHRDDVRDRVRSLAAGMLAQWLPAGAGGQAQRVGERFAVVAAAGELAAGAGLLGWGEGEATQATKRCFDAWLAARGGHGGLGAGRP